KQKLYVEESFTYEYMNIYEYIVCILFHTEKKNFFNVFATNIYIFMTNIYIFVTNIYIRDKYIYIFDKYIFIYIYLSRIYIYLSQIYIYIFVTNIYIFVTKKMHILGHKYIFFFPCTKACGVDRGRGVLTKSVRTLLI